jgi:hypothetical protein
MSVLFCVPERLQYEAGFRYEDRGKLAATYRTVKHAKIQLRITMLSAYAASLGIACFSWLSVCACARVIVSLDVCVSHDPALTPKDADAAQNVEDLLYMCHCKILCFLLPSLPAPPAGSLHNMPLLHCFFCLPATGRILGFA